MQQDPHTEGFAGSGFALFEPGAVDDERLPAGSAFDAKRDVLDVGNLEGVDEETGENILHAEGDGQAVRN